MYCKGYNIIKELRYRKIQKTRSASADRVEIFLFFLFQEVTNFGEQQLFLRGLRIFGLGFRLGGLFQLGLGRVERLDDKKHDERDQNEIDHCG